MVLMSVVVLAHAVSTVFIMLMQCQRAQPTVNTDDTWLQPQTSVMTRRHNMAPNTATHGVTVGWHVACSRDRELLDDALVLTQHVVWLQRPVS